MKQSRHQLTMYGLLIGALITIFWKKPQSARMPAADIPSVETPTPEPAKPSPVQHRRVTATPIVMEDKAEAVSVPDEVSMTSVIEAINPMQVADFTKAATELKRLPAEQVSAFFIDSLHKLGADHNFERDRLVMLANTMQLSTDLPFWEDLVRRQTPRYPNESELRNPKHPTLESRFVDIEQLQAIRNIGILARDNRQARRVLMEIILTPDPSAHRTLHREEAYIALKETDVAASLRVLKQLPAEDDLLKRL